MLLEGFLADSLVRNLPANAREMDSIPEWVEKFPQRRKCKLLQYFCLENPMDKEAWWATIHRFAKSQIQLINYATTTNVI